MVHQSEVVDLLTRLEARLSMLGQTFSADNFTDRGKDSPKCIQLATECHAMVKRIEKEGVR